MKTKISESQAIQFALQLMIFILPFTSFEFTAAQIQAAAFIAGSIAAFTWNQRRKDKINAK